MKGISLAVVGLTMGLAASAQATLLTNDGGLENWTNNNDLALWVESNATVTRDAADKTEGAASANLSLGSDGFVRTGNFGQLMQADRTYTFTMDYKPLSTTGTEFYVLDVRIWLFDAGNNVLTTWGPEDYRILNATNTPELFNTWNEFSFDFGADTPRPISDGTAYGLILVNTWNGTSYVGHIDNLQVAEVPEPASAMLLAGTVAMFGLRRRR